MSFQCFLNPVHHSYSKFINVKKKRVLLNWYSSIQRKKKNEWGGGGCLPSRSLHFHTGIQTHTRGIHGKTICRAVRQLTMAVSDIFHLLWKTIDQTITLWFVQTSKLHWKHFLSISGIYLCGQGLLLDKLCFDYLKEKYYRFLLRTMMVQTQQGQLACRLCLLCVF